MTISRRWIFLAYVVILNLLALPVIAKDVPRSLVLETGITIENVVTRINNGMVWVTFPDGHMEAYSTEDVDLEASGLAPKTDENKTGKSEPIVAKTHLSDAKSAGDGLSSALRITDADVDHILPEDPEEEALDQVDKGPLIVSNILHSVVNGRSNVKGTVTNTTSSPISNITVAIVAIGFDGAVVANGTTRLARPLGPKKATEFSLMMAGTTEFKEVKARASGTASGESAPRIPTTRPSRP